MTRKMLINAVDTEEHRIAFVEGGLLDGFHIDTATAQHKEGNIYKGVIEGIEPKLQACFVNFGEGRNGFLPINDIHPEYYTSHVAPDKDKAFPPIQKVLKKGQEVLVEVIKDMPGSKGAHLTTFISLAGRSIVLTPGRTINGISKKIEKEEERQRIKDIMSKFKLPDEVGYIVRTVAQGKTKRELSKDLNRLVRLWKDIRKKVKSAPQFSLIHKEDDLSLRTLRDYYTSDVSEVIVDDKENYKKIKDYIKIVSPRDGRKVKLYKDSSPIFDHYNIEKQIESIYLSRVPLKSGGSLVFDPTEALISIDVNSGRGKTGKDNESMIFKTNLEAAEQITRQLRLRDLGGLIVVDFIDMRDKKNIREVEKAMREGLKKDRAKTDVAPISKFGLMELSRQRLRPSIESKSYQTCSHCKGRGTIMSVEASAVSFMRRIQTGLSAGKVVEVKGVVPLDVCSYILNKKRDDIIALEKRHKVKISVEPDTTMTPGDGTLDFVKK
jgi:ribonuclease E